MKASDLFLKCLEAQGVDTIYGVPGEENADIMISLLDSPIDFVTCRHEQTASFMADMHGRLTGKPAVCLATLGPGATNLLTGVANANMDYVPLVAVIGQADTHRLHKESHQNMDSVSMFEPVTKWSATIREAEAIPEIIEKAFKVACTGKPGAVLIELPEDIAKHDTKVKALPHVNAGIESGVDRAHLDKVLELIAKAKKGIVLVGNSAAREHCDEALTHFVDKTGFYGACTFMGKGTLSANHPRSLYTVGLGMKDIAVQAFDEADLVICVGYDMVEWGPDKWNGRDDKTIIHISDSAAEVDKHYLPTVEIVGHMPTILRQLSDVLPSKPAADSKDWKKLRDQITEELHAHDKDAGFPVKPQRILSDLREAMGEHDILISDVGAHKMWVARHYPAYHSKTCFIHNGFCSMGGAMPGGIVAKQQHPERNVVALCGDGGFMMSIQALVTAVQYKIPMTVLVWEDNEYGLIKWKQEMAYHQHSHIDLDNPDLLALSTAFGANAIAVDSAEGLKPALEAAFAEKTKPSVIIVPVDYRENMKLTAHLGEIICHS
ncbi:MAG: acetolactate synthase [marine bacterium B5-7]|nr:MAG: acetolactate synthase [marine bacterium B5-7]